MPNDTILRLTSGGTTIELPIIVDAAGALAAPAFEKARREGGVHLLLKGDRNYAATLRAPFTAESLALVEKSKGKAVLVVFPGRRPVRRLLAEMARFAEHAPAAAPIDLTEGRAGAAPLWLFPDGTIGGSNETTPAGPSPLSVMVSFARWISSRRTSTFERLFPPSAFHPDEPLRTERLTATQATALLDQVRAALASAAVGGDEAKKSPIDAAQLRSACLTALSHIIGTAMKDPGYRAIADAAAAEIFRLIDAEQGDATAHAAIRAHAIGLLQLRGSALGAADQARAVALLKTLIRAAPPYADLHGAWNFAMCSAHEFHDGEVEVLEKKHGFKRIEVPAEAPLPHNRWSTYTALEAPFKTPSGDPIRVFARSANPTDENHEMGEAFFIGLLINRHAQLGSFDLRASTVAVQQKGYKVMMNSQCAGLTTRFAISRMFPDADVYSSWDSTYFSTEGGGDSGKVIASEGLDCFVALLQGMRAEEPHAKISDRIRRAQWSHEQASAAKDFVQFVGPAHPLVAQRFNDINRDGRADIYDGFLDLRLSEIAEDIRASLTPRDPGVAASQIGGEAATGLDWASGSMNRVTQYSDLWANLQGESELLYVFQSGGFFSHREPPADVPHGKIAEDLGRLPAVCRFAKADGEAGYQVEVMFHAWLGHSGKELKRLLVAAEAFWKAIDLGYLKLDKDLAKPLGQRCMLLLTLAGVLEFPGDQNQLDGLWSMALNALRLPPISRSAVRDCITEADHDRSNYYGSRRGLRQLADALEKSDPVIFEKLSSDDPLVGRAAPLNVG